MYALVIHGGAGALLASGQAAARDASLRAGLTAALSAGQRVLEDGGCALDAVEAAVAALEDDAQFNAARGAVLTIEGTVELDAAIMDGATLRAGAVAQVRRAQNPVQLARHVLEHLPHVFLAGDGADRYALEAGVKLAPDEYFITSIRREQLAAWKRQMTQTSAERAVQAPRPAPQRGAVRGGSNDPSFGTVGAVACDRAGHLAAATSTGGTVGKRVGRVGDTPVIGAGTYADDHTCAVSATGHGEWLLRTVQAYDVAARLRYGGCPLPRAIDEAVEELTRLGARAGLIAVDARGQVAMHHNTETMLRASVREGEPPYIGVY